MEHGQVRAILGRHAQRGEGASRPADPTLLVPASSLRKALEGLTDDQQRRLAEDYVHLWARTFRTLARHLRGRPERAIGLFAEELYPFLRGDRRAARLERTGPRQARLTLAPDLPAPYLAGLVRSFVALSGAEARAEPLGHGVFDVSFRLEGRARLARASQAAAALRFPLLLAALLAALTGLAFVPGADPGVAVAVVAGTVAAQGGANLLHAARRGPVHPFAPPQPTRAVAVASSLALYAAAGACAAWLIVAADRPGVAAFAALGLALGLAYDGVRGRGLGPAIAALTYGALVPVGAAYAADPSTLGTPWVALFGMPLGLAAAAVLFLDNLADRPLDEAGGQRTLAVRLPQRSQVRVYAGLLATTLLWLAALAFPGFSPLHLLAALVLAVPAASLVRSVRHNAADPHDLAAARLGSLALMAAVGVLHAAWLVGA